jgi:hypothetical protein
MRCHPLPKEPADGNVTFMMNRKVLDFRTFSFACGLLILMANPGRGFAQPTPSAVAAFHTYQAEGQLLMRD